MLDNKVKKQILKKTTTILMELTLQEKFKLGLYKIIYDELRVKEKLSIDEKKYLLIVGQFFEDNQEGLLKDFKNFLKVSWTEQLHQEYVLFLVRRGYLFLAEEEFISNHHLYKEPINFIANILIELLSLQKYHLNREDSLSVVKPFIDQILNTFFLK